MNSHHGTGLESGGSDDLLRPEPRPSNGQGGRSGCALFGLMLAGIALFAIYVSSPVDMPEFPDCPIQTLGLCGHY